MVVAALMLAACAEEEAENPNPPRQQTTTESGLSKSFASNCARCHGDEGRGMGIYPQIPGTRDEAAFISIVRSGKGDMPATDASQFPDDTLKADYAWLTTKRK